MENTLLPAVIPTVNGNGYHGQTGPKTRAGKSRSSMNAFRDGCDATDDIFVRKLDFNERNAFQKIRRSLRKYYRPSSALEKLLVDRMAIQNLRMLKMYQLENDAVNMLPIASGSDRSVFPHLDRLSRYDVRIEKQLRILHNRLISLQNPALQFRPNYLKDNE